MIGKNLKRIRKVKGLTQDKLSELTNISITSIQRYESGKRQPTIETINKFIEALGVSIEELLYKDGEITEMTTGEKIKYYRKNLNLTQQELADLAGISLRALSNYEGGTRVPPLEIMIRLAKALNVDIKDLDAKSPLVDYYDDILGKKIKLYRKYKSLTQKQLADKIGVSEITIRRYESNQKEPKHNTLIKIAEALDISIKELIDYLDIKTNNLAKLQRYYEQKKWEYENIDCERNIGNQGVLKGLEIAINIMSNQDTIEKNKGD